jgi:hypothetical protein
VGDAQRGARRDILVFFASGTGVRAGVRLGPDDHGRLARRAIVGEPALDEPPGLVTTDATAFRDERVEVTRRVGCVHGDSTRRALLHRVALVPDPDVERGERVL